jgi:NitT/TauT family transport system permease protein
MVLFQVVLTLIFLLFWQGASGRLVDNFFISNPIDVSIRLFEWTTSGFIFVHLWITLCETIIGFVVGSGFGILLGLSLGVSRFLGRLLNPFVFAFNALPKVALAPLFILWLGLGIESKVALSAVIVFFLVFINTYAGVREVDQELIDTVRLMRGTKWHVLTKVVVPSSVPWMFVGLKIAVPYSLIGAIVGEFIASNAGLGFLLQLSGAEFDIEGFFAVLVVIGLLAVVMNLLVDFIQARIERWKIIST